MSNYEGRASKKYLDNTDHSKGIQYIADTDPHVTVGISQVETITCTAGAVTGTGNITMTITSATMFGSPLAIVVALVSADSTAVVTTKLKAALNANYHVSTYFTVGGTATTTTLTPIIAVANDTTLAFGYVDTDTTGATFSASADTTLGVIPDSSVTAGEYYCEIECITATTFAVLTPADGFDVVGTMTAVAYPVGTTIYGLYKTIDLTSGSILVYKR